MLYKPTQMQPYLTDIDATTDNIFYITINATSDSVANNVSIAIYDESYNKVWTSEPVVSPSNDPYYNGKTVEVPVPANTLVNGRNYLWQATLLGNKIDNFVTSGEIGTDSTTTNIKLAYINTLIQTDKNQYMNIDGFQSEIKSISSDQTSVTVDTAFPTAPATGTRYIIQTNLTVSDFIIFRTRSTPTVSIKEFTKPITSKNYTFQGIYTQDQDVDYLYYQWNLFDRYGELISTSGQVSYGDIAYTVDGLISGEVYGIQLIVENRDNTSISTPVSVFQVSYAEPELIFEPEYENVCTEAGIKISWSKAVEHHGGIWWWNKGDFRYLQDVPFIANESLELVNPNSVVFWEKLEIPYESTGFLHLKIDKSYNGILFQMYSRAVSLLAIQATPPTGIFSQGSQYYNTETHLIYTAVSDNVWGDIGVEPDVSALYATDSKSYYIYNDSQMEEIPISERPSYLITYQNGKIYYNIKNLDIQKTGIIPLVDLGTTKWLLQPQGASPNENYVWDITETWDTSLYWTLNPLNQLDNLWVKLTLLPDKVLLHSISVDAPNMFREANSNLFYAGVLYSDYKLLQDDVLYR